MAANAQVRALWQRKLDEQHASGLSVTAWCAQQDIAAPTFYYWRKQLTVPATVPAPTSWAALEPVGNAVAPLTLRVGRVAIKVSAGFDPRLLADVLAVVEGR